LEEAIRQLRRAQEFNPAVGHANLGILYAHMGLERQALAAFQRASDIDPSNSLFKARFVEGLSLLGRDRDSLQASDAQNLERQVWALLNTGQLDAAESVLITTLARTPNSAHPRGQEIILLALKGKYREAEMKTSQIDRLARDRSYHHATFAAACAYAVQGKPVQALEWLQKTSDYGMPNYTLFSRSPHLDKIRNDSAFVAFMADLKKRYDRWQQEFQ
jgi:tetratricopeptide (TPR) repeat protein